LSWYRYDPAQDVLTLRLHVQPNARRCEFAGLHGAALKVRVAAPATDFKANALLIDFLRKSFHLPAGKVMITQGGRARAKVVQITDGGPGLLARIRELSEQ
jgi:uncharacterized protein (TIGR00251 family)